jgi:hypothetical protein
VQLQASEVLCLLPILAFWFKKILLPTGQYNDHCRGFLAIAEAIFILSEGQMWGLASKELYWKLWNKVWPWQLLASGI